MTARFLISVAFLAATAASVVADQTSAKLPPMTRETRMQLIRLLTAEYAWARKPFPRGEKGLVLKAASGELKPNDQELLQAVVQKGPVARPGDRVQITNVEFKGDKVILEINGGPVKKAKWYQRIRIAGAGGETPIAQGPDPLAKGSFLTVEFKKYIPEMTLADFHKIVEPIFDFTVKSAAQAYTETLPENVRNAIRDHKVLVGMNKEMVTYSKGRPPQRLRERDKDGTEYEEWIYGQAPADVEFVKFVGDEVVQLKIMRTGEEKLVKTEKEVDLNDPAFQTGIASAQRQEEAPPAVDPAKRPTLRRPGEPAPNPDQPN